MLQVLTNMFGFIWQQPIDVTLSRMKLLHVGLIVSSQIMIYRIIDRLGTFEGEHAIMAYVTIAGALITQIWAAVATLHRSADK